MGLIDGIYAIAMTLIAIELPRLVTQLMQVSEASAELSLILVLLLYELIIYTVTFMLLYELWSFHKSILTLSGIKSSRQSFVNGLILALTCLGAGNIILILNSKTQFAADAITADLGQMSVFKAWISHGSTTSIFLLIIISGMFALMSILARAKINPKVGPSLKVLERSTRVKAVLFFLFIFNWLPLVFFGQRTPLVPEGFLILSYIALCHVNGVKLKWPPRVALKSFFILFRGK